MNILERPAHSVMVSASNHAEIISHYELVAPLMEHIFGRIPIVWTTPNPNAAQPPIYHCKYFGHWSHLSSEHVQHLVSIGAQEFHSWFPLVDDPARARFARFLLERPWADTQGALLENVRRAALVLADILCHPEVSKGTAIPVLDGVGGISLFVPLAGGPAYPDVRTWAHRIAREAIAAHPDLFSEGPNVHDDGRVHIHVSSNALDRWSIMPYSIRTNGTRVATPVTWDELPHVDMMGVRMADFPARLSAAGDVFGTMLAACHSDPLCHPESVEGHRERSRADQFHPEVHLCHPEVHLCHPEVHLCHPEVPKGELVEAQSNHATTTPAGHPGAWFSHGILATGMREILADGVARTAQEIWQIAQERKIHISASESGLVDGIETYLAKEIANGRKPVFVRAEGNKFRINEPPDSWPAALPPSKQTPIDVDALVKRLQQTSVDGAQSEKFEVAVCDAFTALGLLTTHVGGHGAPDGYADAPLGTMGYRLMIECKSGETVRKGPDIYEAAKYKDAYHAQYCLLIGAGSGTWQQEAIAEIKTHGVALWCVDDLVTALQNRVTPLELVAAISPGVVAQDIMPDVLWARDHGARKRVCFIGEIVRNTGWTTQLAAAQSNAPADAPLLTVDAAMLLVDQELAAQGAHVNCTREEVRLAFEWLTNPLNGTAVWNADKTAIVIQRGSQ
jgi:type III secretion system FlhB-like substrate exporter